MMVYRSRFTPGLKDGKDVSFEQGEVVTYRTRDGKGTKITIESDLMEHPDAPGDHTGYDSVFHDTGKRAFASRQGILDWEGKV